jgi:ATP adenylyltransferase
VSAADTIESMSRTPLHAPWRMEYIKGLDKPSAGGAGAGGERCFLCDAAAVADEREKRERLVLWTSAHCVVVINKFPYTNGHLLIAPKAHIAELEELSDDLANDLTKQTTRCITLLKRAISPQGFNIGINIGRCAGAGLPGHVHQHVVPRWGGDTNFMSVVGEVRVVPQAMSQLYDELMRAVPTL